MRKLNIFRNFFFGMHTNKEKVQNVDLIAISHCTASQISSTIQESDFIIFKLACVLSWSRLHALETRTQ